MVMWLTAVAFPVTGVAQQRLARFDSPQTHEAAEQSVQVPGSGPDLVSIGKWAALAASIGAGTYGLLAHFDANDKFERLQRICESDSDRCQERTSRGAYADPELENLYQDVLAQDRAAKIALIASQVSIAGSVVLFIMDLGANDAPPNIPYNPKKFRLLPTGDGAQLQLSFPAPRW